MDGLIQTTKQKVIRSSQLKNSVLIPSNEFWFITWKVPLYIHPQNGRSAGGWSAGKVHCLLYHVVARVPQIYMQDLMKNDLMGELFLIKMSSQTRQLHDISGWLAGCWLIIMILDRRPEGGPSHVWSSVVQHHLTCPAHPILCIFWDVEINKIQ